MTRGARLILLGLLFAAGAAAAEDVRETDRARVVVETVAGGFDAPWSLAFLPDGDMLVTERPGGLWRVSVADGRKTPLSGAPRTREVGQGGLLDLALAPDFTRSRLVYFAYAGIEPDGRAETRLARGRLSGDAITDLQEIYAMRAPSRGGRHFGGRLAFDRSGALYLTIGDRGQRARAQDPGDPAGSVLRFLPDGRPHPDNPFVGRAGARPEIFSYGHRNPQGMALHPETGEIWTHEHGPRGGDEINVIAPGRNYGWPVITYGEEYSGGPVGAGRTAAPGLEQPLHYWVPSIAPSGLAIYDGAAFPDWRGDLFVGALKDRWLERLRVRDGRVVEREILLERDLGRVRDVRAGPDGFLYLLIDAGNGALLRLRPPRAA